MFGMLLSAVVRYLNIDLCRWADDKVGIMSPVRLLNHLCRGFGFLYARR